MPGFPVALSLRPPRADRSLESSLGAALPAGRSARLGALGDARSDGRSAKLRAARPARSLVGMCLLSLQLLPNRAGESREGRLHPGLGRRGRPGRWAGAGSGGRPSPRGVGAGGVPWEGAAAGTRAERRGGEGRGRGCLGGGLCE